MKLQKYEHIFKMSQPNLKSHLKAVLKSRYKYDKVEEGDGYLYAKGTHPVLLVAHLDTVHKNLPTNIYYTSDRKKAMAVEGIGGDDRCGVIIILEILKRLHCSVVFCEDEEVGGVGASKFGKSGIKLDVNYAVEFDRKGGNDYVFYKTANDEFEEFVASFGFKSAWGSFSDISLIADDFQIEAVNISSGYYNPHTASEYVNFVEMEDIISRATEMIATETKKFEYEEDVDAYYRYNYNDNQKGKSYTSAYYTDDWGDDFDWEGYYYGTTYSSTSCTPTLIKVTPDDGLLSIGTDMYATVPTKQVFFAEDEEDENNGKE